MSTESIEQLIQAEVDRRLSQLGAPDNSTDGKPYVVVRSRNQGVMSGYLDHQDGQFVRLLSARQLWRWNSRFVLTELAEFGINDSSSCKFSAVMSQPAEMLEACGILYCSKVGGESIRAQKAESND